MKREKRNETRETEREKRKEKNETRETKREKGFSLIKILAQIDAGKKSILSHWKQNPYDLSQVQAPQYGS